MKLLSLLSRHSLYTILLIICSLDAYSATVNFSGQLVVLENTGGVYSSTPAGTTMVGFIDDATFNGQVSDGTTTTPFGCCIAAGGLSVFDNMVLSADDAAVLNSLGGPFVFTSGMSVDGVDIEGDVTTASDGRIEVGVSYLFDAATFSDSSPSNYPFDPGDVLLALFFIVEEDMDGLEIYSAVGRTSVVPLPGAAWLFGAGITFLLGSARRKRRAFAMA